MLGEVKSGLFLLGVDLQADRLVDDPQDDPGRHEGVSNARDGKHKLAAKLGQATCFPGRISGAAACGAAVWA